MYEYMVPDECDKQDRGAITLRASVYTARESKAQIKVLIGQIVCCDKLIGALMIQTKMRRLVGVQITSGQTALATRHAWVSRTNRPPFPPRGMLFEVPSPTGCRHARGSTKKTRDRRTSKECFSNLWDATMLMKWSGVPPEMAEEIMYVVDRATGDADVSPMGGGGGILLPAR